MSKFATTDGESTLRQLAERLYDTRNREALRRAEKALADANSALVDIKIVSPGTPVEVPTVRDVEFTAATGELTDVAGATALYAVREVLPELGDALRAAASEQVRVRRELLGSLNSAKIKRIARDDPALQVQLEEAVAHSEAEVKRAVAFRDDEREALGQLESDINRLIDVFGTG
jgi:hypothetical protein